MPFFQQNLCLFYTNFFAFYTKFLLFLYHFFFTPIFLLFLEPVFLSVNRGKFTGYELATESTLKKRAGEPVPSDPMKDKTNFDIPEILQSNLRDLSQIQRHFLTKKFEKCSQENSKMKMKNSQKLVKARAANMVSLGVGFEFSKIFKEIFIFFLSRTFFSIFINFVFFNFHFLTKKHFF